MNQQDNNKNQKHEHGKSIKATVPKIATNPNTRANENLDNKQQQVSNSNQSSSSAINSEITDGEDA